MTASAALVLSDFDGTITIDDVTVAVWERHLPFDWRQRLLPLAESGALSAFEMIRRGWEALALPPEALRAAARAATRLRPGFDGLTALCERRGWPFAVVSNGLRWYIADALPPDTAIYAYDARYDGGAWRLAPPAELALADGEDLKVHVLERLRARHPGAPVAYIGDGSFDFPAARRCERVFAVAGSSLARLCARHGVPCAEFQSFDEVSAALA